MEPRNPYAPPVESSDAVPPPPESGMALSEAGWATVTGMAKWMRIVSVFFFIAGALLGLSFLAGLVGGGMLFLGGSSTPGQGGLFAGGVLLLLVMALLFIFGAIWLRQAAFHFYDGVLSNTESALAQGFRKLRLYMIAFGIYGILRLAMNAFNLLAR